MSEEADFEKRIKEYSKPVKPDWEKDIEEFSKPVDQVERIEKELKEEYGVEQRKDPRYVKTYEEWFKKRDIPEMDREYYKTASESELIGDVLRALNDLIDRIDDIRDSLIKGRNSLEALMLRKGMPVDPEYEEIRREARSVRGAKRLF